MECVRIDKDDMGHCGINWMECVRIDEDDMGHCGMNEETCERYRDEDVLLETTLFIFADETTVRSGALGAFCFRELFDILSWGLYV
jgi:hypothetical protein